MTARARKQPDRGTGKGRTAAARKRQASGPGFLQRSLLSLGAFAARHPSIVGGGAAFAVVFSFVAANALWYQPGGHPSPILKTRSGQNSLGFSALREEPSDVTTFVIRREGEEQAAGNEQDTVQPSELVLDIQTELARQGFYAGDPDGRLQEETVSAIRRFQQERGLSVTGTPDAGLLAALHADAPQQVAVLPTERPLETGGASEKGTEIDPVAAAIRAAEADPVAAPASAPAATASAAPAPAGPGPSSALVMKIQKGLSNIAYADITVDGVAGSRTREAIRAFEKHYRLPTTGEPNDLVLSKLKEIGAL